MRAGGLAQPGDRSLDGHRAEVGIVDRDEGPAGAQMFVGEQLLGVVDGRGRNVFGEEHLHDVLERVRADPRRDQCVDLVRPRACRGIGSTYSGRAARSGRSIARYTRAAMLEEALEMAIHRSSEVRYALRGALASARLPVRPWTCPSWS